MQLGLFFCAFVITTRRTYCKYPLPFSLKSRMKYMGQTCHLDLNNPQSKTELSQLTLRCTIDKK